MQIMHHIPYTPDPPPSCVPPTSTPRRVLYELISSIPAELRAELASIAIDGTSATAMLLDRSSGQVLAPAKLYNESQPAGSVAAAKVGHRALRGEASQPASQPTWSICLIPPVWNVDALGGCDDQGLCQHRTSIGPPQLA